MCVCGVCVCVCVCVVCVCVCVFNSLLSLSLCLSHSLSVFMSSHSLCLFLYVCVLLYKLWLLPLLLLCLSCECLVPVALDFYELFLCCHFKHSDWTSFVLCNNFHFFLSAPLCSQQGEKGGLPLNQNTSSIVRFMFPKNNLSGIGLHDVCTWSLLRQIFFS